MQRLSGASRCPSPQAPWSTASWRKSKRRAGWLAARYLDPTQHRPPPPPLLAPLARYLTLRQEQRGNRSTAFPAPSLSPPLRSALYQLQPTKRVLVSSVSARLISRPCSLPLRLHTHQAAFHIKLDLRPSTPPSVAHTLPTHPIHLRLPPPPCRGSSPRVRRRQCRPDLPTPRGLSPTSTP